MKENPESLNQLQASFSNNSSPLNSPTKRLAKRLSILSRVNYSLFNDFGGEEGLNIVLNEFFHKCKDDHTLRILERTVLKDFIQIVMAGNFDSNFTFLSQRLRLIGLTPKNMKKVNAILLQIANEMRVDVDFFRHRLR